MNEHGRLCQVRRRSRSNMSRGRGCARQFTSRCRATNQSGKQSSIRACSSDSSYGGNRLAGSPAASESARRWRRRRAARHCRRSAPPDRSACRGRSAAENPAARSASTRGYVHARFAQQRRNANERAANPPPGGASIAISCPPRRRGNSGGSLHRSMLAVARPHPTEARRQRFQPERRQRPSVAVSAAGTN